MLTVIIVIIITPPCQSQNISSYCAKCPVYSSIAAGSFSQNERELQSCQPFPCQFKMKCTSLITHGEDGFLRTRKTLEGKIRLLKSSEHSKVPFFVSPAGGKLPGVCSSPQVPGWCERLWGSGRSCGPHDWNHREGGLYLSCRGICLFSFTSGDMSL